MDIRLVTVKEDFEKAYNILNQEEYPLSFYEYALKHENFLNNNKGPKLIGVFDENICLGSISYQLVICPILGNILEIKEVYQKSTQSYQLLFDFLDKLAIEENCQTIKIHKNQAERMNENWLDRLENFLKNIIH